MLSSFTRRSRKQSRGESARGQVAVAVAGTHPDISLAIWKKLADGQIDLVKPKAYEEAAGYLRQMRGIYPKFPSYCNEEGGLTPNLV